MAIQPTARHPLPKGRLEESSTYIRMFISESSETYFLLSLLQLESLCGLVANLRWTPVLDRTWIYISCLLSPLLTLRSEELEWSTVELYESLADNWLVGTVTTLDVHHHCDRHTTSNPLSSRSCCVLDN